MYTTGRTNAARDVITKSGLNVQSPRVRTHPAPRPAVRPARCLARDTGGLRFVEALGGAPTTCSSSELIFEEIDILSLDNSAKSSEYVSEKLGASSDDSESSSDEGSMTTLATVIHEIT